MHQQWHAVVERVQQAGRERTGQVACLLARLRPLQTAIDRRRKVQAVAMAGRDPRSLAPVHQEVGGIIEGREPCRERLGQRVRTRNQQGEGPLARECRHCRHPARRPEQMADTEGEPVAIGGVDLEFRLFERSRRVRAGCAQTQQKARVVVVGLGVDGERQHETRRDETYVEDGGAADDRGVEFETGGHVRAAAEHDETFYLQGVAAALHGAQPVSLPSRFP